MAVSVFLSIINPPNVYGISIIYKRRKVRVAYCQLYEMNEFENRNIFEEINKNTIATSVRYSDILTLPLDILLKSIKKTIWKLSII